MPLCTTGSHQALLLNAAKSFVGAARRTSCKGRLLCGSARVAGWKRRQLDRLNDITDELDDALHVDAEHRRDMNRVARRIREGHELLNDPTRFFVKEGDLIKKSRKLGRQTKYRFFLFSDILIYSKHIPGTNEFKIHDELPLHCLKLVDWFPSKNGSNKHSNSFEIHHPRKSFWVVCSSERERMDWVATIRSTCEEHSRRLAQLTAQQNGL